MNENIFVVKEREYYIFINIESFKSVKIHRGQIFINGKLNAEIERLKEPVSFDNEMNFVPSKAINPTFVLDFKCNYNCQYCYQKDMRLNKGRMKEGHIDGIDKFYDYYCNKNKIKKEFGEINIIGGEPFLEDNKETIEYIAEKWVDSILCFTTNGTNVISYIDFLTSHKTKLKVSLDGTKQMHYRHRKTNEKYAFEKTIEGIKILLEKDKEINIVAVFDPEMLYEYPDFFSLMETLGWISNPKLKLAFIPQFNYGCDDITDLKKVINSFLVLLDMDNRTRYVDARKLFPGSNTFFCNIKQRQSGGVDYNPYRCSCLYYPDYWFLPDGTVHFCFYTQIEETRVGKYYPNIQINQRKIDLLKNRRIDLNKKCKACTYKFLCKGGCAISALAKTQTISGEDCSLWVDPFFINHYDKIFKIRSGNSG